MSRINEKLGIKAQTRTRKATHASSLISSARCPKCGGRHVIQNVIRGRLLRMCGSCSEFWPAPVEAAAE